MTFDSSVKRLIKWGYPHKNIILDEDGSITGKGPGSWATNYYQHHEVPECEHNISYWGGTFCDNTIAVRRVALYGAEPAAIHRLQGFKILPYDDDLLAAQANVTDYLNNKSNYGTIMFKQFHTPSNGWATPFVTGHKYKIHFGMTGLDYEELKIDLSAHWQEWDKPIYLVHNWTDVRAAIDFKVGVN